MHNSGLRIISIKKWGIIFIMWPYFKAFHNVCCKISPVISILERTDETRRWFVVMPLGDLCSNFFIFVAFPSDWVCQASFWTSWLFFGYCNARIKHKLWSTWLSAHVLSSCSCNTLLHMHSYEASVFVSMFHIFNNWSAYPQFACVLEECS